MKHSVEAPVDKVKELILLDFPHYYSLGEARKKSAIALFVKPMCHEMMFKYMEDGDGGENEK